MGRPSSYSPEIVDVICSRIADGESLRSVCSAAGMPDRRTIYRWLRSHVEFVSRYSFATDARAELIAEEVLEIADDASGDYKLVERNGELVWVIDPEVIQRARLRIDTRKWTLAKLAPKKYGYGIGQERSGPNGAPVEFRRIALVIVDTPRLRSPLEAAA